jgi:hypothetical protein
MYFQGRRGSAFVAVLCMLSACSGGGSGTGGVPITLQGATIWENSGDASSQVVRAIEGGDGGDFRGVIFVDDGFLEFLQQETGAGGGEVVFFRDAQNQARLFEPSATGSDDYENIRLISLRYSVGTESYQQIGYIGRATPLAEMALATGSATYVGTGTVDVIVNPQAGGTLSFPSGNAAVTADFGASSVDVVMNRPGQANWDQQRYDEFRITGMVIDGNTFSGGTFSARKNGATLPDFGTGDFQATGFFAGFNDGSGTVGSGDVPGETAGAFRADSAADGVAFGYFAAD